MTDERRAALERLFARIGDVTTLPAAAKKVLQLTEDENADPDKLREAIQSDPVLVARILRRLNSSYYALSHKISDLKTAISLLGMREIRNLALTVFVSRFYEGGTVHGTYKRENLWSHSVGVAVASRLVARVCGRGACEEAYIAGLLHDLGLILLDQTLRRHFHKVLDAIDENTPTHIVENADPHVRPRPARRLRRPQLEFSRSGGRRHHVSSSALVLYRPAQGPRARRRRRQLSLQPGGRDFAGRSQRSRRRRTRSIRGWAWTR